MASPFDPLFPVMGDEKIFGRHLTPSKPQLSRQTPRPLHGSAVRLNKRLRTHVAQGGYGYEIV